jgi:hypothetical protein
MNSALRKIRHQHQPLAEASGMGNFRTLSPCTFTPLLSSPQSRAGIELRVEGFVLSVQYRLQFAFNSELATCNPEPTVSSSPRAADGSERSF